MRHLVRSIRQRGRVPIRAAAVSAFGRRSVPHLLVAVLATALASPLSAQFSATPVILEMETTDDVGSGVIRVRNEGEETLPLRLYAGDFDQNAAGEHRFMEPASHDRSCASRLHFFPEAATLAAGEDVQVVVRLDPGAASCWSVIFVESGRRADGSLRVVQRIAVKVYGGVEGGRRAAEVREVAVRDRRVMVDVENTGDRPVLARGEVEIRSTDGVVLAVVPFDDFSMLPARRRHLVVELPADLSEGRYLAIPIVDFGGDYLAGGQTLFEVD